MGVASRSFVERAAVNQPRLDGESVKPVGCANYCHSSRLRIGSPALLQRQRQVLVIIFAISFGDLVNRPVCPEVTNEATGAQ